MAEKQLTLRPEDELGPAMRKLNEQQRLFVMAKLMGANNTDAARMAGYKDTSNSSLKVAGYRCAHNPDVQAALLEEGRKYLRDEGSRSLKTLIDIRDNPRAEDKDRLKAALAIMDRGGFNAVTEHKIEVEHKMTDEEVWMEIARMAAELGWTRAMLVTAVGVNAPSAAFAHFEKLKGKVIEVEAEPIPSVRAPAEEPPDMPSISQEEIDKLIHGEPEEPTVLPHRGQ